MEEMIDTGLRSLVILAKNFQIPVELHQLERGYTFEAGTVDETTILKAAHDLHLRASCRRGVSKERLDTFPLPLMLKMSQGNYVVIIGRHEESNEFVIYDTRLSMEPMLADPQKIYDDFSGTVILFTRRFELSEAQQHDSEPQGFGWSWFWPVVMKYGRFLGNVFAISFLLQLLGLASPLFTQVIIDKVLVHRSVNTLDILLLGMLLSTVFQQWMLGLRSLVFSNITSKMDATLGSRLYQTIMRLPAKYFDRWQVGDVVSRVGELDNLRNFLTGSSLTIVLDIVFALIYLVVLFLYSRQLSIVVLVVLPFFVLLNVIAAPIYKKLINNRFLVGTQNRSFMIETITGIHTVKNCTVEENFVNRYEEMLSRYVMAVFSVVKLTLVANSIGTFLQHIFSLAILWVGALHVMNHEMTVGELIAFQMIAGQLIAPVMRLVDAWQYFQQARVSMARLGDIMDEEQEIAWSPNRTTLPGITGDIQLQDVSFSYRKDNRKVLDGINLGIPAGMRVGIVGRSGSGKSTLTKLIQRLYIPDSGNIRVDGVDIAQVEPAWLRRQIGVVLQDSMLFSGTIEENIKIAVPNATHEDVVRAAQLAGAAEFIDTFPHGYETFVGERGGLLSGGQRQRIAIARALMTDPRILIFDEATSALDYESEAKVMQNLDAIASGRTVLMIAHRLSTVRDCDAIVVIDEGHLVEAGTHDELMEAQGAYYKLWVAQKK